jgi:hypothetical protein
MIAGGGCEVPGRVSVRQKRGEGANRLRHLSFPNVSGRANRLWL